MEPYDTEDYKGYTIEIHWDDSAGDPYKESDQMGVVVLLRSRDLSGMDGEPYRTINPDYCYTDSFERIAREWLADEDVAVVVPFRLDYYGSNGWRLSISSPGMPDNSNNGFTFISRATLRKEYGGKIAARQYKERAAKVLRAELETWGQWLNGDVCGYVVKDEHGDVVDSCWGFYGAKDAMDEAKSQADWYARERADKHALALVAGV